MFQNFQVDSHFVFLFVFIFHFIYNVAFQYLHANTYVYRTSKHEWDAKIFHYFWNNFLFFLFFFFLLLLLSLFLFQWREYKKRKYIWIFKCNWEHSIWERIQSLQVKESGFDEIPIFLFDSECIEWLFLLFVISPNRKTQLNTIMMRNECVSWSQLMFISGHNVILKFNKQ